MLTRLVLCLGLLWPGLVAANDWDALDQPGAFAIMRHALAPGTGDPAGFDIDDCSTQRTLSDQGRDQARVVGAAFAERGIAFGAVLTSEWCRCSETAELLALGPVEAAPALNSFFGDYDQRASRTEAALALLRDRDDRLFVVTHQVNISALAGQGTRSGEVLVVRAGADGLEVLGSIYVAS